MEIKQELRDWIKTIPVNQDQCLLFLLAVKHGINYNVSENIYIFLSKEGIIERDYTQNTVVVNIPIYEDDVGVLPKIDDNILHEVESRVEEYRKLFKGIRAGSMGNKNTIVEFLQRFCIQNHKTFDEVLKVVNKVMETSDKRYFPNADNFIYDIDNHGKERSRLEIAFDEYEEADTGLFREIN